MKSYVNIIFFVHYNNEIQYVCHSCCQCYNYGNMKEKDTDSNLFVVTVQKPRELPLPRVQSCYIQIKTELEIT